MQPILPLTVLFFILLGSCATSHHMQFKAGSGDAGLFILQRATACGGKPIIAEDMPVIAGPWRFSEDQYGVVIRLPREDYEAVEQLLFQAFGEPTLPTSETTDGKFGCYELTPQGGGIQFGYDAQGTEVVVLREVTEREMEESVGRVGE